MKEVDLAGRMKWARVRVVVVALVLLLAAGRIMARGFEIQVLRKEEYSSKAREQHLRSFQLPPSRGALLDRNGNELAVSVMVPSVYANPEEMKDIRGAASALSQVLGVPEEKIIAKLESKEGFVWIKRRIGREAAGKVRDLDLMGVHTTFESKRFYPHKSLASHVLGFSGYDAVGLEGVELEFNSEMIGQRPVMTGLRDARGRMIFAEGISDDGLARENSLVLSIDKVIQGIVEEEIVEFVRLFEARAASVVVVDPSTGEILAMANHPDFNPNLYWEFSADERRNRAVTDRFEPGSTMKVFTMAAAIEKGSIKITDLFYCHDGEFRVDDLVIRDAHRDEWLTPIQIIQRSSNIGITKIAFQTGKEDLYKILRRFGFGEKTGVAFPGETAGFLRHHTQWYDVDFASISFGQGVSASVLQLAMAVSAIANGGRLLQPIMVRRVISSGGATAREYRPRLVRKVMEKRTSRILAKMMVAVTREGGTGTEAAVEGFDVSGKTGTAQKPDTISGGYMADKWIASFIGFVPTDEPRLAIAVMFDEPLINYYGGVVAAPLFRRVAERSLRYLGVVPKGAPGKGMPGKKEDDAPKTAGEEKAPLSSEETCAGDCVDVPDFVGLSLPAVMGMASGKGLKVKAAGSGRAVDQSVPAGQMVARGTEIAVGFASASL